MIFGVFDALHDGHRFFLSEAEKLGDRVVAVVASDENVVRLKGRAPVQSLTERMEKILEERRADLVVASDNQIGAWTTVKIHRPDIIALGYDQDELRRALADFISREHLAAIIVRIKSFRDKTLHSSKLRDKKRTPK